MNIYVVNNDMLFTPRYKRGVGMEGNKNPT